MLTTTLAEIRGHNPCVGGFAKIRDHLGVSPEQAKTHEEPFPITLLLETNGIDDALWVFGRVAPQEAVDDFLIRRLDTGRYSALKTLRSLDGDFATQIEAVENVVVLLRRRMAGEDVARAAADAADAADAAADAARAAYAARAATFAAADAARAADAAADAARAAYAAVYVARAAYAAAYAADAAYAAADAATSDDLHSVCRAY